GMRCECRNALARTAVGSDMTVTLTGTLTLIVTLTFSVTFSVTLTVTYSVTVSVTLTFLLTSSSGPLIISSSCTLAVAVKIIAGQLAQRDVCQCIVIQCLAQLV